MWFVKLLTGIINIEESCKFLFFYGTAKYLSCTR